MTNEKLNAYLDGELSDPERRDIELQLERDPNLRAELEQLQSLDGMLRNEYKQSPAIAENVISKLTIPERRRTHAAWFALPLAAAAGLVLGILIQKNTGETTPAQTTDPGTKLVSDSGKSETNLKTPIEIASCSLPEHQSIGMLTLATAPFSTIDGKLAREYKIGDSIVKGAFITTPPDVRAALALGDGSELRLDRGTAVEITDRRQLTIRSGRVWLRSAPGEPFVILMNNARVESPAGETICSVQPDHAAVEQYKGSVSVIFGQETRAVKEYETVDLTNGVLGVVRPFFTDPFATAWLFELRVLAGMQDEELVLQVNGYFEALRRTKGINPIWEALALEMASHSKLAIARFYESNQSHLSPEARSAAKVILDRLAAEPSKNSKQNNSK
ncbi:MAG: FecR domain-containing protein [Planctomycetota bacterium]